MTKYGRMNAQSRSITNDDDVGQMRSLLSMHALLLSFAYLGFADTCRLLI